MHGIRASTLAAGVAILLAATQLLGIVSAPAQTLAQSSRRTLILNADWRFLRSDTAQGAQPQLDDAGWSKVTLPHSFNANDGEQPDYYRGPAWYRRTFEIARLDPSKHLYVEFGAAATSAEVFLNGNRIGMHRGGHAAFRFDLTPALKLGRNLLAVKVSNAPDPTITPLGGDFTIFGGLYRSVSLIETDPVHVDLMDNGGPGVYAHVDALIPKEARIRLRVRVANEDRGDRVVPVIARIINAEGKLVATGRGTVTVAAHAVGEIAIPVQLANPRLWDGVRDPYLYRADIVLEDAGDSVSVPLGLRHIAFDPSRGMLLNGKPYPLHGVNLMHSARPGRGTAVGTPEIDEDFAIVREMGSTGVRLTHFQHPEEAYAAADRLGLVTWTEIGINSRIADTAGFRENATQQMRELIAQTYNHPSVAVWGVGNEVYDSDDGVLRALSEAHAAARQADPDRPTIYAHCCQADDAPKASITDLIAFNRYFGWYPDQKGTLGGWAAAFHAAHPERAFAISEYGAGASIQHQEDPPAPVVPASGWHPEQYQALFHERSWREIRDKPYIFGTFVWVAFDLASGGRNEGDRPGINDKGLVTYDRRVRKDAWYWYQANWSSTAMLHLTSKRFVNRTSPLAEVKAYTNGGAATLIVNGRRVGTRAPVDHVVRWNIMLQPGKNRIVIEQGDGPAILRDATIWTYAPRPAMLAIP
jgi:beta-galactosidase